MTTKTHIIKSVFTPTLLYQSEHWTLTGKERQMLTTTEMRCLWKAAEKTRMGKIRNEEIRRRVNTQPAEQTANKNKIRWWSHVKRMAPTAPQSKALVIQPEGRRPRGRPQNRWEDDVPAQEDGDHDEIVSCIRFIVNKECLLLLLLNVLPAVQPRALLLHVPL